MDSQLLPPPRKSWNDVIAGLPSEEQNIVLDMLGSKEVEALVGDWFLKARREQIAPPGDWFIWMIMAGRGFGKNWSGSNWLIDEHRLYGAVNSGIIAATSEDLRRYCIEGPSGILACAPNDFRPEYQPSKTRLIWPNDTVTLLFTSEKADRLRGPNLDRAWCDEVASWRNPEDVLDMLYLCLRYGPNPKMLATTTPRPIPAVRSLLAREGRDAAVTRGSTFDNKQNLAEKFIQKVIDQFKGTRLERQELYGEVLDDFEGALWDHIMLDKRRCDKVPGFKRTVIGVDPPTTVTGTCGIVAAGKGTDGRGYVLGDHSISGSPETWAAKAVAAYHVHQADAIVAEVNQGGDMVESTIHNIDPMIKVIKVRAAKGKVARAEPVSMLYEQGRIDHFGMFPELEDEMCIMVPGELDESPDRVDALVWALYDLFIVRLKARAGSWGRKKAS